MNKIHYIFWTLFLTCLLPIQAQTTLHVSGRNHYNIHSYNGFQTQETQGHKIQLALHGPGRTIPKWTITARINSPLISNVPNVSGLPFPTEKIKFRFTQEDISGNPPSPWPTLSNIGANLSPIPLQQPGVEVPVILNSQTPIQTGQSHYVQLVYYFAIDIEGGRYLEGMLSENGGQPWNTNPALYQSTVTFTFYDENRNPISSQDYNLAIQVHRPLRDAPVDEAEFSLSILGEARNGTLTLSNLQDYTEGKSVLYQDALKVNSSTAYEVSIKTLQDNFISTTNNLLPVNIVKVQLSRGSNGSGATSLPAINLASYPQAVISNHVPPTKGVPQLFNIQYSIPGNDQRMFQAKTGNYSGTVLYQLYPR